MVLMNLFAGKNGDTNVKNEFLSKASALKYSLYNQSLISLCLRALETGSRCLLESLFYSKSLFQGAGISYEKNKAIWIYLPLKGVLTI